MAVHRRISGLEFCPGLRWLARAVLVAVSIAFMAALLIIVLAYRRRSATDKPAALSQAERRRLKRLLKDG